MYKLSFLIITLSFFLGAGCTPDTTQPTEDVDLDTHTTNPDTDWGTAITNNVDSALIGTWKLTSLTTQGYESNFKGRTLIIGSDGSMSMDYSTEIYTGPTLPGHECEISGTATASFVNSSDYNLDYDGETVTNEFFEYIKIKKIGGGQIITCGYSTTNLPNVTLGIGPSLDGFVEYSYTVSPDWNNMTLSLTQLDAVFKYELISQ